MSARAAAQLEFIGFREVYHYQRGKVDWTVRGLPTEPRVPIAQRLRMMPYFVNNLVPWLRSAWIRMSRRATVADSTHDDLARMAPDSQVRCASAEGKPAAVVLNREEILLGVIDAQDASEARAADVMNPAPQTIRPDMTPSLAAALMDTDSYLLVTDAHGRYVGRYIRLATEPWR